MKPYELTIATLLLLAFSLPRMAQKRIINRDVKPQAPQKESIKIERINQQDILRVASPEDTIRIPFTSVIRDKIENLMQSKAGTSIILKDINGADVNVLRVVKRMKPGVYFRNKMRKSISVFDEELRI